MPFPVRWERHHVPGHSRMTRDVKSKVWSKTWFCMVLLCSTTGDLFCASPKYAGAHAIGHCPQTLNSTRTLAKDIVTVAKKSLHWKHPLTGRYLRALNWLKKVRSTELPHFTELLLRCIKCSKHGSTLGTLLKGIVDPKNIWDKATCGFDIALIYFLLPKARVKEAWINTKWAGWAMPHLMPNWNSLQCSELLLSSIKCVMSFADAGSLTHA